MTKRLKRIILILAVLFSAALLATGIAMIVTGTQFHRGNQKAPRKYSINCVASAGVGVDAPVTAEAGEEVKLTILLEDGYFLHTIEADGQKLSSATFLMPARDIEVRITASKGGGFYAVRAEQSEGGNILPAAEEAQEGSVVFAEIRADAGYRLRRVFANGAEVPFAEEKDFVYRAKAYMQGEPLVFSAEYAENPYLEAGEQYVLEASYSPSKAGTAVSYWKTECREEGIFLRVLVQDGTVVQNGRLEAAQRDHIEFYLCPQSASRTLYGANALHCLVTADGTFLLQKCLADGALGESGKGIGYEYGKSFTAERILCTLSKNNFDGYAIEVFLGYDLFGGQKGSYVYAPALYNCIGSDGGKNSKGFAYASSWREQGEGDVSRWLLEGGSLSETDPSTYLTVGEDKTELSAFRGADLLLLGDGLFASPRFGTFEKTAAGNVRRAAFGGLLASDLSGEETLSALKALSPAALALSFGRADMESGASAYTAADRVLRAIGKIREALPETELLWCALPPDAEGDSEPEAYDTLNKAVAASAESGGFAVADCTSSLAEKGGLAGYVYEEGALTAEGCDRYIAAIAEAFGITYLPALEGVDGYGALSAGWKAEEDVLSAHYADGGKQIAWVKEGTDTLILSAEFTSEGGSTASYGLILTGGGDRLCFFIRERYEEGVLAARTLCYELYEGGVLTRTEELPMSKNGQQGFDISLKIEKKDGKIGLYAGSYPAFTLEKDALCGAGAAAVGVFAENALISVRGLSAEKEGI